VLQDLQGIYTRLQQVALADGDAAQATEADRSAIEIAKKLNLADSQDVSVRLGLAIDYGNLADAVSREGNYGEVFSAADNAIKIMTELITLNPRNTEFRGVLASTYTSAGDVYRRSGDNSGALQHYRVAIVCTFADPIRRSQQCRLSPAPRCHVQQDRAMMAREGNVKGAIEMYNKALELAKSELTSSHPNEEALYSTPDSHAGLGDLKAIRAADTRQGRLKQIEHWNHARLWYERSLKIWTQIKEPGLISPGGFDCIPQSVVTRQLARCNQALQRLGAAARV